MFEVEKIKIPPLEAMVYHILTEEKKYIKTRAQSQKSNDILKKIERIITSELKKQRY